MRAQFLTRSMRAQFLTRSMRAQFLTRSMRAQFSTRSYARTIFDAQHARAIFDAQWCACNFWRAACARNFRRAADFSITNEHVTIRKCKNVDQHLTVIERAWQSSKIYPNSMSVETRPMNQSSLLLEELDMSWKSWNDKSWRSVISIAKKRDND